MIKIMNKDETGVVGYSDVSSDIPNLPLKGITQGSTFFDILTSEVYMFIENENPTQDGEWVTI